MPEHAGSTPSTFRCAGCGTDYGAGLLACPRCRRLAHADALKQLAASAEESERSGDLSSSLAAWREALELLPPTTRQYDSIAARISALSRRVDAGDTAGPRSPAADVPPDAQASGGWAKAGLAGAGTLGLFLLKFKTLVLIAVTKGKLLLLGLTKASTLFSMILSLGVYWTAFGWRFALGLVLSIYVHEMGHIAALRRFGIKAGAPMFIPGLGALIRLQQTLPDARSDARVGLAGPIWGLAAALATYGASLATGWPILAAIARWAAEINLFNLLPIWQLDGSRGFRSMSRPQRWFAALTVAVMWSTTGDGFLVLLLLVATLYNLTQPAPSEGDRTATWQYAGLVVALSSLTQVRVLL